MARFHKFILILTNVSGFYCKLWGLFLFSSIGGFGLTSVTLGKIGYVSCIWTQIRPCSVNYLSARVQGKLRGQ